MQQVVKLLFLFAVNFSIAKCAYTVDGYWEFAHSGNVPRGSFVSAKRPHDGQLHYICRVNTGGGSIMPGKLDDRQCWYALDGEQHVDKYEVLVYRNGINYYWEYNEDGGYNNNAVNGGWEGNVRLLICRVRVKDEQGYMRWVSGKLHPIAKRCYFSWYGEQNRITYEVLMARTN